MVRTVSNPTGDLTMMKTLQHLALAGFLVAGCATTGGDTKTTTTTPTKSLYERLGGKDAITKVVEDFVGKVGADSAINARFANTDLAHFKAMLVDQICQATGGPCQYGGKDM